MINLLNKFGCDSLLTFSTCSTMFRPILHQCTLLGHRRAGLVASLDICSGKWWRSTSVTTFQRLTGVCLRACLPESRLPCLLSKSSRRRPLPVGFRGGSAWVENRIQLTILMHQLWKCIPCGCTKWLNPRAGLARSWHSGAQKGCFEWWYAQHVICRNELERRALRRQPCLLLQWH